MQREKIRIPGIPNRGFDYTEQIPVNQPVKARDRVGAYEFLSPIGEGGMGEVWKARDTRLDRTVAIKFSKAHFEERFHQEALAIAALNHPNIATLYDIGPDYLVMEMVEGAPLRGPLPIAKAVAYAYQILDALDAAHKKGIVHRDLKPANVLVTGKGIKLLDFGLAKRAPAARGGEETLTKTLTSEGQIVGTLQYMAPEQLHGRPADARTDIFAFGCVLYEMLTGKAAFGGASQASVIAAILEREPAPLSIDPPLERLIRTCLAKDPDERFQTAVDLKRSLEWAAQPAAPADRQSTGRLVPIVVAACLVLACAFGWALLRRVTASPLTAAKLNRITRDGQSTAPALSSDGKLIAYASTRSGSANWEIYLQQLNGEGTVRLTDHPAVDTHPQFSADGSKVYFNSQRRPAGIYEVSALGGDARLLVPGAIKAAASPDGKWLAYTTPEKLFVRSLTTGEVRDLNDVYMFTSLVWAPDSRRLLVWRPPATRDSAASSFVSIDGSPAEPLPLRENLQKRGMYDPTLMRFFAWLPSNDLVFAAPYGNTENIWTLPLSSIRDADPRPLTLGPLGEMVTASVGGGKIAFTDMQTVQALRRWLASLTPPHPERRSASSAR